MMEKHTEFSGARHNARGSITAAALRLIGFALPACIPDVQKIRRSDLTVNVDQKTARTGEVMTAVTLVGGHTWTDKTRATLGGPLCAHSHENRVRFSVGIDPDERNTSDLCVVGAIVASVMAEDAPEVFGIRVTDEMAREGLGGAASIQEALDTGRFGAPNLDEDEDEDEDEDAIDALEGLASGMKSAPFSRETQDLVDTLATLGVTLTAQSVENTETGEMFHVGERVRMRAAAVAESRARGYEGPTEGKIGAFVFKYGAPSITWAGTTYSADMVAIEHFPTIETRADV